MPHRVIISAVPHPLPTQHGHRLPPPHLLGLHCCHHRLLAGIVFFELALDEKVICVPGLFFDINPNKRRQVGGERPCLLSTP